VLAFSPSVIPDTGALLFILAFFAFSLLINPLLFNDLHVQKWVVSYFQLSQ
jgi:hypothetical protein